MKTHADKAKPLPVAIHLSLLQSLWEDDREVSDVTSTQYPYAPHTGLRIVCSDASILRVVPQI